MRDLGAGVGPPLHEPQRLDEAVACPFDWIVWASWSCCAAPVPRLTSMLRCLAVHQRRLFQSVLVQWLGGRCPHSGGGRGPRVDGATGGRSGGRRHGGWLRSRVAFLGAGTKEPEPEGGGLADHGSRQRVWRVDAGQQQVDVPFYGSCAHARAVRGYRAGALKQSYGGRVAMSLQHARRTVGVPPDASPEEVDRAFRRLARRLHPDRGGDAARFRELTQARVVLRGAASDEFRPPLVVVHRRSWWRRIVTALVVVMRRRPRPTPRVR